MDEIEREFDRRVRAAIQECKSLDYHPNDFESMLAASTAVRIAERFAVSGHLQSGLKRLASLGRLDLTIESIMLEPEFQPLFRQQLLDAARWRLNLVAAG